MAERRPGGVIHRCSRGSTSSPSVAVTVPCALFARTCRLLVQLTQDWKALLGADVLFLRADRQPPMVAMPWATWAKVVGLLGRE